MIHIATTHFDDPTWIPIQARYFKAHLAEEYRVYAFLSGIKDVSAYEPDFFYASAEPIESSGPHAPSYIHAMKLNILSDVICSYSDDDDDLLMFIDGDAFPIGDVASFARASLAEYPLLAVQRLENRGDPQPHPCFCMTTVGFWRRIRGDWKPGHTWKNAQDRPITDTGGNLMGQLERGGFRWLPLHRSNRTDLHPLFFGVYHDLVYHHGASFRSPRSRLEVDAINDRIASSVPARIRAAIVEKLCAFGYRAGSRCQRIAGRIGRSHPLERGLEAVIERNRALSSEVLESIGRDPTFYREFTHQAARTREADGKIA